MTAKFYRIPAAFLACMLAMSAGAGLAMSAAQPAAAAQDKDKDKEKDKDKGKMDKQKKAELAAYNAIVAAQGSDPAKLIPMSEDFLTKYPQSEYIKPVYGLLTTTYFAAGDIEKMMSTGNKALELDPENVDALSIMAMVISRRSHSNTPDGAAQLTKAEGYARHAIELIPNMVKPNPTMEDATFEKAKNDKLSVSHSALGLIDYDHKKYEDARTELTQAIALSTTPDPVDYYMLGNSDSNASYYKDAVAAYKKCSESGPPLGPTCKTRMDVAQHDSETKMGR